MDRGAGDYEILFRRSEDETGKPLCIPVAYDNKGIPILRAKIDCDTPSNEVGMGAALFIMGAIGIAFVIHQKFKAKREKAKLEAAQGGSSKKEEKKRPMKRPAKKPGKAKEKKGGFFGKSKKDAKVKPSKISEEEGTKVDGNGDETTKPEGSDENTSHDEKSDEKDATHDEKSDKENENDDDGSDDDKSDDDKSDDDAIVKIEDSDDDTTEKADETQKVESVDLSMNANLVSPKGTKKKKAVF